MYQMNKKEWKKRIQSTITTLLAILIALEANEYYSDARASLIEHVHDLLGLIKGG